jgi:hypothetical protein
MGEIKIIYGQADEDGNWGVPLGQPYESETNRFLLNRLK